MKRASLALSLVLSGCSTMGLLSPSMYTDANIKALSEWELCAAWAQTRQSDERIFAEITERGLLTADEIRMARGQTVQVGMREIALYCSWGRPNRVNRASYGDQLVYCRDGHYCIHNQYVYVERGRVTAWN